MDKPIYQPWSVVKVPFPFTDILKDKRRPAIVLNTQEYFKQHDHYIVLMITSARHSLWPSDIAIVDYKRAGLLKPCVARFKISTVDAGLVIQQSGILHTKDIDAIKTAFPNILDL